MAIEWLIIWLVGFLISVFITRAVFSIPEFLRLQRQQRDLLQELVRQQRGAPSPLPILGQVRDSGDDVENARIASEIEHFRKLFKGGHISEVEFNEAVKKFE